MSSLSFANDYRKFIKGYADKVYPMQQFMRHKGKKLKKKFKKAVENSFKKKRSKDFQNP